MSDKEKILTVEEWLRIMADLSEKGEINIREFNIDRGIEEFEIEGKPYTFKCPSGDVTLTIQYHNPKQSEINRKCFEAYKKDVSK